MHIKHLKLENFRQFKKMELEFNQNLNIIIGENAVGKSSILEAITLITDGYSPWTSDLNEIINNENLLDINNNEGYFRIEALVSSKENSDKEITLSYYHSASQKKFLIDGKTTTRKRFFRFTSTNIFSPEQIELLMISPSKRRDFLNRTISRINLDYQDILTAFERVLKQRNAYLKKLSKVFMDTGIIQENDQMLKFWNTQFAKENAKLMKLRDEYLDKISNLSKGFTIKYLTSINVGEMLSLLKDEDLVREIENILEAKIKRDIILGHTHLGIHRDDWSIKTTKDIQKFGSRGEKRIALSKTIFQIQELHNENLGYFPILLLDDISSELDNQNIAIILSEDYLKNQQVFITSIREDENIIKLFINEHKTIILQKNSL